MSEFANLDLGVHQLALLPLADNGLQLRLIAADSVDAVLTPAAGAQLMAALTAPLRALPGVTAVVPSFDSVTLWLSGVRVDHLRAQLARVLASITPSSSTTAAQTHKIWLSRELDVEFQGDLAFCAEHAGLSPERWLTQFCQTEFTVGCLGFRPGFGYLLGLPEALACPRRANPRLRVPAGAIAVGGPYAGIYPNAGPGGWHVVGRCLDSLFDPKQTPPCRFAVGDTVRFYL